MTVAPVLSTPTARQIADYHMALIHDRNEIYAALASFVEIANPIAAKLPGIGANFFFGKEWSAAESAILALEFTTVDDKELAELQNRFQENINDLVNLVPQELADDSDVASALDKIRKLGTQCGSHLVNFIDAQKHICLGFSKLLKIHPDLPGIPFTMWSSAYQNSDNKYWGPVFAKRVRYIEQNKGSITFLGTGISHARADQAVKIWRGGRCYYAGKVSKFSYKIRLGNWKQ
jgi:hypothetical protein